MLGLQRFSSEGLLEKVFSIGERFRDFWMGVLVFVMLFLYLCSPENFWKYRFFL
jgi:hypothetical protein